MPPTFQNKKNIPNEIDSSNQKKENELNPTEIKMEFKNNDNYDNKNKLKDNEKNNLRNKIENNHFNQDFVNGKQSKLKMILILKK